MTATCACVLVRICVFAASPARLMDEPVQTSLDLVVGQEGHVTRVCDGQAVPIPQQGRPGLNTHNTEVKTATNESTTTATVGPFQSLPGRGG